jgi:hypothetical protein
MRVSACAVCVLRGVDGARRQVGWTHEKVKVCCTFNIYLTLSKLDALVCAIVCVHVTIVGTGHELRTDAVAKCLTHSQPSALVITSCDEQLK